MSKTKVIAEPGAHDFVVEREFDASRERVFRAHIDPEAIPHWWGPRYVTTRVDRLETHKGGVWRFVQLDKKGNEYAFNGVFHECIAPERIVRTYEFEGMPEHVLLETTTFEELPAGRTLMRTQSLFQSVTARDGMIGAGATDERGMELWERLDQLLAEEDASETAPAAGE